MKPFIIPIFIPHYGCEHQCVFCDQRKITGIPKPIDPCEVEELINQNLRMVKRTRHVEVAFYGGSFTALPAERQIQLLTPAWAALKRNEVNAIRVSTRPDSIDEETVVRLKKYGVSIVELGVQSMDDKVLAASARGHVATDTKLAVNVLKLGGMKCGLQLMPGLPEEDWLSLIHTAETVLLLKPDFVRVYPAVVIAGTKLAEMYVQGQYRPLSLQEAVSRAAYLKILFDNANIPVIRYGLQATENLSAEGTVIAGPYHPAFGEMVAAFVYDMMISQAMEDILPSAGENIIISYHWQDHSKLRGNKNSNRRKWEKVYGIDNLELRPECPSSGELAIGIAGIKYIINIKMINKC